MNQDRLFHKCAARLIPFMMALYVVNYVDRVNVGFAALTMNADLHFSPASYGFGAGLFFVGYLLFQVPLSILLQRFPVRSAVCGILLVWGILSAATALVRDATSFAAMRFALGAAEAGFFPLMMLYLTRWFPRSFRTRFTAMFMASIPLASLIAGPISGLILGMDGVGGIAGWQWLLMLEGVPACVLGVAVFAVLPEDPAHASWLSAEEKRIVVSRIAAEDVAQHRETGSALRDPRLIVLGLVNLAILFGVYGVQLWVPQIVRAMGFSNLETGIIASLPYALALPAMMVWGHLSDAKDERIWHIAIPALFAAGGFGVVALAGSDALSLLGIAVALVGLLCMQPPFFALLTTFLGGRAVASGIAFVLSVSNFGSFLGPSVVGVLRQETGGYAAAMAVFGLVQIVAVVLVLGVGRTMAHNAAAARAAAPAQ